jgi:hypothetical protein
MKSAARSGLALILALVVLAAIASPAFASSAAGEEEAKNYKNVVKALKNGKFGVALRYRYEQVSGDAFDEDAYASTLRTAVSYKSAPFHHLTAMLEMVDVTNVGLDDDHNDSLNGVTDRPPIPDPPDTYVNQVTLGYEGLPETNIVLGRQEIVLGDQRFVGAVGWRQNHQSLEGLLITQGSVPRTDLLYSYVDRVNTIFRVSRETTTHLLNAKVDPGLGKVTAYYYSIDLADTQAAALSSWTVGASWDGQWEMKNWKLPFHLQLAKQENLSDNETGIDASYMRAELGGRRGRFLIKAGYELLVGSPEDGRFSTPLATLHKFNGWADMFILTPENGLQDLFLVLGFQDPRFNARLIYHDFRSDSASLHYGTEIDGIFTYTAPWKQAFVLKLAHYSADELHTDTTKLWVYSTYRF